MNEWIDCKVELPTEVGDIEVLIGGRRFISNVLPYKGTFYLSYLEDFFFELPSTHPMECKFKGRGWVIPSHYQQPTHWLKVPKPPGNK